VRLIERPDPLRVRMLLDLGLLIDAGELETGRIALQGARDEARALGRDDLEIRAELELSYLRALIDPDFSPQDQEALAREAIGALEPRNDHEGLARAWFLRAAAHWSHAHWDQMQEPLSHSIDHARRAANRSMELSALTFLLAAKLFGSTPVEEGIRFARQTLEDDSDSRELEAWAYRVEGTLMVLQGRIGDARALLERARAIFAELGSTISLAVLAFSTGMLELTAGDARAAEREYRTAIESLQRIGERGRVTNLAAELADVLLDQGRDDEADTYVSLSREGAQPTDASGQAFWRMASARLLVRRGEIEEAVRLANEAAAIMAETDELLFLPEVLLRQGEVLELAGRQTEATKAVRGAIELFERKGATEGVRRAHERLAALDDR